MATLRPPDLAALEQGKYVPSVELAFRIARAFQVAVEGVFQFGGNQ